MPDSPSDVEVSAVVSAAVPATAEAEVEFVSDGLASDSDFESVPHEVRAIVRARAAAAVLLRFMR